MNPFFEAAEYLEQYGWQRHSLGTNGGPCCIVGALLCGVNYREAPRFVDFFDGCIGRPVIEFNDDLSQSPRMAIATLRQVGAVWEAEALCKRVQYPDSEVAEVLQGEAVAA